MTISRLLLAFVALSCFGQDGRYLLSLKSGADLSGVLGQYHLSFIKQLRVQPPLYAVASNTQLTLAQIRAIGNSKDVLEFERDEHINDGNHAANLITLPSLADLGTALTRRDTVNLAGAIVRGSYASQPAADLIELPLARNQFAWGYHIVAVIDTGVDFTHPALKQNLVPGYDFLLNRPGLASDLAALDQSTVAILDQSTVAILDNKYIPAKLNQSTVAILDQSTVAILDKLSAAPAFGHGTMVAGLIHLVAPTARIMPLRAFGLDGTGTLSNVIQAIYYAVDHGASVINMSFSFPQASAELDKAIAYAASKKVLCIASAGNEGKQAMAFPAGSPGAIGVGSTSARDRRSTFSNFGVRSAEFAAPGEALITTYPGNNYAGVWGTSFSNALVSGAAALMLQVRPNMNMDKAMDAFAHGKRIDADMGDARLDLPPTLWYCLR